MYVVEATCFKAVKFGEESWMPREFFKIAAANDFLF
jgi:hypothetical protein